MAKRRTARTKKSRTRLVLPFRRIGIKDVPIVGGKNASLGEMVRRLTPLGVAVPDGFATTADAYRLFVRENKLDRQIRKILRGLDTTNIRDLAARGKAVRDLVLTASLSGKLEDAIMASYRDLEKRFGANLDVAVRSSATAEDLPDASFAGQQETYLNIRGRTALLDACRKCFASLFTDRAIAYRVEKRFDHFKVALSIGVQKMVRSDLAASGIMFTIDTESGFRDSVIVNGSWGLGETIVQGRVTPDEWVVFKPMLDTQFDPVIARKLGEKNEKMLYGDRRHPTVTVATEPKERDAFCLAEREVKKLAAWGVLIEKHYKKPMDMEWAKDGRTGELFIVQARPETVASRRDPMVLETYHVAHKGRALLTGMSVGKKIGQGKVRVIRDVKQINSFQKGDVLVTEMTDPDWVPVMKQASAIVTDSGGRTCHAAIVSRELGVPCIVGTGNGSRILKTGQAVTVDCSAGEEGTVYAGLVPFRTRKTNIGKMKRPKTKVMLIAGEPGAAFEQSFIPNDGIGLARQEFIVASAIQAHPLACIKYPNLKDRKAVRQIAKLIRGYPNAREYYISKLADGIATIAASVYPKPVIVRLSDFKTNEYANLVGGAEFEPLEANPMIGWRGASRYYDPKYKEGFALECRALKRVRDAMGLTNVKIMVPFCRTVAEGKLVVKEMAKHGLKHGKNGLQVYVMAEIPSNILNVEAFAGVFDGFSIGSNDLTQLTLGVDRDSSLVAHLYDERDIAVKRLLGELIAKAHKAGDPVGICGQAPSDFPDLAEWLVEKGIDSISLQPDTVVATTLRVLATERSLARRQSKRGGKHAARR